MNKIKLNGQEIAIPDINAILFKEMDVYTGISMKNIFTIDINRGQRIYDWEASPTHKSTRKYISLSFDRIIDEILEKGKFGLLSQFLNVKTENLFTNSHEKRVLLINISNISTVETSIDTECKTKITFLNGKSFVYSDDKHSPKELVTEFKKINPDIRFISLEDNLKDRIHDLIVNGKKK